MKARSIFSKYIRQWSSIRQRTKNTFNSQFQRVVSNYVQSFIYLIFASYRHAVLVEIFLCNQVNECNFMWCMYKFLHLVFNIAISLMIIEIEIVAFYYIVYKRTWDLSCFNSKISRAENRFSQNEFVMTTINIKVYQSLSQFLLVWRFSWCNNLECFLYYTRLYVLFRTLAKK